MSFDETILFWFLVFLFCVLVWLIYHIIVGWKHYKVLIAKEKEEEENKKKGG